MRTPPGRPSRPGWIRRRASLRGSARRPDGGSGECRASAPSRACLRLGGGRRLAGGRRLVGADRLVSADGAGRPGNRVAAGSLGSPGNRVSASSLGRIPGQTQIRRGTLIARRHRPTPRHPLLPRFRLCRRAINAVMASAVRTRRSSPGGPAMTARPAWPSRRPAVEHSPAAAHVVHVGIGGTLAAPTPRSVARNWPGGCSGRGS